MAVITDMGVTGNGILQPKLKHKFELSFIGLAGDGEGLKVQAVTCELPKLEFEEVTLDRYNSRAYVAGKHSFQPISATFEDDVGGEVVTAIRAQQEMTQHIIMPSGFPRLASAAAGELYKFRLRIDELDGNTTKFASWALDGCWFQNVDYGELDYTVSEALRITTTIRFDHAQNLITGKFFKAHNGGAALTA